MCKCTARVRREVILALPRIKGGLLLVVVVMCLGGTGAYMGWYFPWGAWREAISSSDSSLSIAFRPSSLDLGRVSAGGRCRHKVLLQNLADRIITITGSASSCSCTTADVSGVELAPGESLPIEITFNSDFKFGKQNQFITVRGHVADDDSTAVSGRLVVTAEVERDQYVEPEILDLKNLSIGVAASSVLQLHRTKATDWNLSLELPTTAAAGRDYSDSVLDQVCLVAAAHPRGPSCDATLKVVPRAPAGSRSYVIRIHSGAEGASGLSVLTKYTVQSRYNVDPSRAVFPRVNPMADSAQMSVNIRSKTPNAHRPMSIRSVPPWAKATLTNLDDRAVLSIEICVHNMTKRVLHDAILLNTEDHLEEVLRIPILVLVQ